MKKKSGIILSALPLLTLGLCFISNSSFANGVNGNEVILVNSMEHNKKRAKSEVLFWMEKRVNQLLVQLSK